MIKISIDLLSANGPHRDKHLGDATICNIGGTYTKGNYEVELKSGDRAYPRVRLYGFPRKRRNHWDLLFLSLVAALGREKCEKLLKETATTVKALNDDKECCHFEDKD